MSNLKTTHEPEAGPATRLMISPPNPGVAKELA
jgi:hypothetical protein